jgi:hypothetical protein
MKRIFIAVLAVLAAAGALPAVANAAPWDGGPDVRSTVEQKLHDISLKYPESNGRFEYVCLSPTEWPQLIREDPNNVWGVVFPYDAPTVAWLAPHTCQGVERLMLGKNGSKICQTGTNPIFETTTERVPYWATERKKVASLKRVWLTKDGKRALTSRKVVAWKTVKVKRYRDVESQVQTGEEPVFTQCPDWMDVLFAGQTVPHETMHMFGQGNEAIAECHGMQNLAFWVQELSGDSNFGREAADDYWAFYKSVRINDPDYGTTQCYPGGPLDLAPADSQWPQYVAA